jgi:hypothetical protein
MAQDQPLALVERTATNGIWGRFHCHWAMDKSESDKRSIDYGNRLKSIIIL